MVKICDVNYLKRHAKDENTLALVIVRQMTYPIPGATHCPVLSPSRELFYAYCGWKRSNTWDADRFREDYVPRFLSEIRNSRAAHEAIADIWERDREGQTVLLACYCGKEELCHRSIVAGLLMGIGIQVQTDTGRNYMEYYRMLRRLPRPAFAK